MLKIDVYLIHKNINCKKIKKIIFFYLLFNYIKKIIFFFKLKRQKMKNIGKVMLMNDKSIDEIILLVENIKKAGFSKIIIQPITIGLDTNSYLPLNPLLIKDRSKVIELVSICELHCIELIVDVVFDRLATKTLPNNNLLSSNNINLEDYHDQLQDVNECKLSKYDFITKSRGIHNLFKKKDPLSFHRIMDPDCNNVKQLQNKLCGILKSLNIHSIRLHKSNEMSLNTIDYIRSLFSGKVYLENSRNEVIELIEEECSLFICKDSKDIVFKLNNENIHENIQGTPYIQLYDELNEFQIVCLSNILLYISNFNTEKSLSNNEIESNVVEINIEYVDYNLHPKWPNTPFPSQYHDKQFKLISKLYTNKSDEETKSEIHFGNDKLTGDKLNELHINKKGKFDKRYNIPENCILLLSNKM